MAQRVTFLMAPVSMGVCRASKGKNVSKVATTSWGDRTGILDSGESAKGIAMPAEICAWLVAHLREHHVPCGRQRGRPSCNSLRLTRGTKLLARHGVAATNNDAVLPCRSTHRRLRIAERPRFSPKDFVGKNRIANNRRQHYGDADKDNFQ